APGAHERRRLHPRRREHPLPRGKDRRAEIDPGRGVRMSWQRVAAVVAGGSAAALAEALEAEGAVSVEIADAQAGTPGERFVFGEPGSDDTLWPHCRVSALFDEGEDASAAFDRALAASATPSLEAASLDRVQDADWVAQTQ